MKIVNLALFTLLDYYRRTWFYAEVILVAILIFLFRDQFWLLNSAQVFPALGIFSIILATVTTLRITHLETNTRIYIPLTKALRRNDYLAGKALAVLSLDTVILAALFILTFALTSVKLQFTFGASLLHLIPLLLIQAMAASIMLSCSSLVSNQTTFFWGIILLILGAAQPWQLAAFILPPVNRLIVSSFTGGYIWYPYLLAIVYIAGFYKLSQYLFNKRELNYEPK